ncbi:MAG: hypothetical protein ACREX9_08915, partial [Gammaproteobacteria bacterium]
TYRHPLGWLPSRPGRTPRRYMQGSSAPPVIFPVRGQMLLYRTPPGTLAHIRAARRGQSGAAPRWDDVHREHGGARGRRPALARDGLVEPPG